MFNKGTVYSYMCMTLIFVCSQRRNTVVVASVKRTWILKISKDPDHFNFPPFSKM